MGICHYDQLFFLIQKPTIKDPNVMPTTSSAWKNFNSVTKQVPWHRCKTFKVVTHATVPIWSNSTVTSPGPNTVVTSSVVVCGVLIVSSTTRSQVTLALFPHTRVLTSNVVVHRAHWIQLVKWINVCACSFLCCAKWRILFLIFFILWCLIF